MSAHEHLLCAVLRGTSPEWSGTGADDDINAFLGAARYHGVLQLVAEAFRDQRPHDSWPEEIWRACHEVSLAQAMYELAHRAEIIGVLDTLVSADVKALILKGTALAYSHYANPVLRPRGDTDLLIPRSRRRDAERVLAQLGYVRDTGVEGEFISYQATWSRSDCMGVLHALDIHWRINNSQILANTLSYEELEARATPLPLLGANALAPAPVDALLFACIHRAGHANVPYYVDGTAHPGGNRLIWLYDIHLLVSRMSAGELDDFARLAASKRIRAICLDAVQRTSACFGTPIPSRVADALGASAPAEASALYLSGGNVRQMVGNFLALERWSDRGRWARETAFPPARYMRRKYSDAANTWLPILYARRGITGIAKLIRSRSPDRKP
jgi:hypothetical protein